MGPYDHWFQPGGWLKNWILWFYGFRAKDWDHIPNAYDKYEELQAWIRSLTLYKWLLCVDRWVSDHTKRKICVKIHDYDVWSMDSTLAPIILPMLKLLKVKKQGAPSVDDDDVPEELRSTAVPPVDIDTGHTDANWFKRWEWVMDEMIWAFEQINDENSDDKFFEHEAVDDPDDALDPSKCKFDKKGYEAHQFRIDRGLRLFGKYFRGLWD